MKNNQPVTNNEVQMRSGSVIVSRTDLKGAIVYINQDFLDISGFSEAELIGKSHNIVRHPDMPSAAFKDLWDTMKAGKPWVGMVKNRCKNGDYYWVEANVTPVYKDGQIVEYLSVRKIPGRDQISTAEVLYSQLNSGTASLPSDNPLSSLFNIRNRIIGAYSLMILFMLALGLNLFGSATIGIMIAGILTTIVLTILTVTQVINPINNLSKAIKKLQEDPLNTFVDYSLNDELGGVQKALKSLQIKVSYDIMGSREEAERSERIKQALDNVSSNVMLADTSYDIIYMNQAVQDMFNRIEPDLKKVLPDFNAGNLLGTNIDVFHKAPSHQRRILDSLTATYSSTIEVAGLTLTVTANPVLNEEGIRRGTVVEWLDRTEEVAVEHEVENIVQAGMQGDLSQRIDLQDKSGFFKQLGSGINDLMDVISDSFSSISYVMKALSVGDLTKTMSGEYSGEFADIQTTINTSMSKLQNMVSDIRSASGQISSAANEISQGNTDLSQRTEEQAASLEETASSMEELTSTVKQNADNSRQANQLAAGARDQAQDGGEVIESTIKAMEEINDSSTKIEDIIGVIDEIAFQTNLLALNAAVEAARAGEQGKGFAVVASEVRSLAQRSAAAAKEIKVLIKDSVEKVEEGSRLVDDSGQTLAEIVTSVRKVSDIIAEIAASSNEQSAGIEQINQAITQLDEVTQQNAALVEEAAAASESMDDQSTSLNEMMNFFNTGDMDGITAAIPVSGSVSKAAVIRPARPETVKKEAFVQMAAAPVTASDDSEWEEF
ncbi:MAG: PAS domain-containing protein [gamma proteobacterium symbiont of Taylorina sp.]|nr:PAS domain-containing protein [gamma proteobacterium symbiont of Taylorina sp.]